MNPLSHNDLYRRDLYHRAVDADTRARARCAWQPQIFYSDSASPMGAANYHTGAVTMWTVTSYFVGKMVW